MNTDWSFQRACLEPLLELFKESDVPAALLEPTPEFPYLTLVVKFLGVGSSHYEVQFELTLPPGASDPEGKSFLLLLNGTLKKNIHPAAIQPLTWMANALNTRLSLGALVVLEAERQLIFRQSLVYSRSVPVEHQVRLVDQQFGVILHELELFIDALMEVAARRQDPKEALRAHPMGNLFSLGPAKNGA